MKCAFPFTSVVFQRRLFGFDASSARDVLPCPIVFSFRIRCGAQRFFARRFMMASAAFLMPEKTPRSASAPNFATSNLRDLESQSTKRTSTVCDPQRQRGGQDCPHRDSKRVFFFDLEFLRKFLQLHDSVRHERRRFFSSFRELGVFRSVKFGVPGASGAGGGRRRKICN